MLRPRSPSGVMLESIDSPHGDQVLRIAAEHRQRDAQHGDRPDHRFVTGESPLGHRSVTSDHPSPRTGSDRRARRRRSAARRRCGPPVRRRRRAWRPGAAESGSDRRRASPVAWPSRLGDLRPVGAGAFAPDRAARTVDQHEVRRAGHVVSPPTPGSTSPAGHSGGASPAMTGGSPRSGPSWPPRAGRAGAGRARRAGRTRPRTAGT